MQDVIIIFDVENTSCLGVKRLRAGCAACLHKGSWPLTSGHGTSVLCPPASLVVQGCGCGAARLSGVMQDTVVDIEEVLPLVDEAVVIVRDNTASQR